MTQDPTRFALTPEEKAACLSVYGDAVAIGLAAELIAPSSASSEVDRVTPEGFSEGNIFAMCGWPASAYY